jgi:hypothetical protein
MRSKLVLGLAALVVAVASSAGVVQASGDGQPPANADITLAKGEIHVKGHKGWHINTEYRWKVQLADGTKFDKEKNPDRFEFDAKDDKLGGPPHVKVHAPSGQQVLISGAVCSTDSTQCENFTRVPVTVP